MPRSNAFTKDMFIEAAFRILREKGAEKLSARSLARELKCSTMPVYSYLKSMNTLVRDLEEKSIDLMLNYQTTSRTGRPFFDMGLGYVIFARNEKNIFRFLYLRALPEEGRRRPARRRAPSARDAITYAFMPGEPAQEAQARLRRAAFAGLIEKMRADPTLAGLDDRQLERMLTKMWIFTHGLAFLINNNSINEDDDESIYRLINDTGFYVIQGERHMAEIMDKEALNENPGT